MIDPAKKYPEIFEELSAAIAASLTEHGIAAAAARAAAGEAAEHVRLVFGGQYVYFPMGLGYNLARRNAEIRRRLAAGESRETLCREFNLSNMQLRRIEADDTPSRGPRDSPTMPLRAR